MAESPLREGVEYHSLPLEPPALLHGTIACELLDTRKLETVLAAACISFSEAGNLEQTVLGTCTLELRVEVLRGICEGIRSYHTTRSLP